MKPILLIERFKINIKNNSIIVGGNFYNKNIGKKETEFILSQDNIIYLVQNALCNFGEIEKKLLLLKNESNDYVALYVDYKNNETKKIHSSLNIKLESGDQKYLYINNTFNYDNSKKVMISNSSEIVEGIYLGKINRTYLNMDRKYRDISVETLFYIPSLKVIVKNPKIVDSEDIKKLAADLQFLGEEENFSKKFTEIDDNLDKVRKDSYSTVLYVFESKVTISKDNKVYLKTGKEVLDEFQL